MSVVFGGGGNPAAAAAAAARDAPPGLAAPAGPTAATLTPALRLDVQAVKPPPHPQVVNAVLSRKGGIRNEQIRELVYDPRGFSIFRCNINAKSKADAAAACTPAGFASAILEMQKNLTLRNQSSGPDTEPFRWELEKHGGGMLTNETYRDAKHAFLNYTFFPVVRQERERGTSNVSEVVSSMMVIYSSAPPVKMLPHEPDWQEYTVAAGGYHYGAATTFYVDVQLLGDNNCVKAVKSALNTMNPVAGSYICIVPCCSRSDAITMMNLHAGGVGAKDPKYLANYFRVDGASLGLAFCAAIGGLPPIHYTGYLHSIQGPRTALAQSVSADQPALVVNTGPSGGIVETVDGLAYKAWYAISRGLPMVIPLTTWDGWSSTKLLQEAAESSQRNGLYHQLMGSFVTIDQLEAGEDYMKGKAPVLIAKTLTDVAEMASLATYAYEFPCNVPVLEGASPDDARLTDATRARLETRMGKVLSERAKSGAYQRAIRDAEDPQERVALAKARRQGMLAKRNETMEKHAVKRQAQSKKDAAKFDARLKRLENAEYGSKKWREANKVRAAPSILARFLAESATRQPAIRKYLKAKKESTANVRALKQTWAPDKGMRSRRFRRATAEEATRTGNMLYTTATGKRASKAYASGAPAVRFGAHQRTPEEIAEGKEHYAKVFAPHVAARKQAKKAGPAEFQRYQEGVATRQAAAKELAKVTAKRNRKVMKELLEDPRIAEAYARIVAKFGAGSAAAVAAEDAAVEDAESGAPTDDLLEDMSSAAASSESFGFEPTPSGGRAGQLFDFGDEQIQSFLHNLQIHLTGLGASQQMVEQIMGPIEDGIKDDSTSGLTMDQSLSDASAGANELISRYGLGGGGAAAAASSAAAAPSERRLRGRVQAPQSDEEMLAQRAALAASRVRPEASIPRARSAFPGATEGVPRSAGAFEPIALFSGADVYPYSPADTRNNSLGFERGQSRGEAGGFFDTLKDIGRDAWGETKKIARAAAPALGRMALSAGKKAAAGLAKKYLGRVGASGRFARAQAYGEW